MGRFTKENGIKFMNGSGSLKADMLLKKLL